MTDTQSPSELLPCPFCGASADDLGLFCDPEEGRDNSGPSRRIQCFGCNIEAPFYDTKAEAITAWNQRTQSPQPAEALTAMVTLDEEIEAEHPGWMTGIEAQHCLEKLDFVLAQDDWSLAEKGKFLVQWGHQYRAKVAAILASQQEAKPAAGEAEALLREAMKDDPSWVCAGIPDAAIDAGVEAWDRAHADMENYIPTQTPDWDEAMIVAAIFKAVARSITQQASNEGEG